MQDVIRIVKPQLVINREIALGYLNGVKASTFKQKISRLQNKPQPAQRTEEWYSARETRITASEAANCLTLDETCCKEYVEYYNLKNFKYKPEKCANSYSDLNSYLIDKTHKYYLRKQGIIPAYMSSEATRHGQKYEEEAVRLYTLLTGDTVYEFGLVTHSRLSWLGASPDGITSRGVMLEIKCPKSREITGVPPFHYFIQCQIQLECCNLDVCHFLECEFEEVDDKEVWLSLTDYPKGILLKRGEEYIYAPKKEFTDQEFIEWSQSEEHDEITYYKITSYTITTIPRMKNWFANNKPILKKVHEKLMWLQSDPVNFKQFKDSFCDPNDLVCML